MTIICVYVCLEHSRACVCLSAQTEPAALQMYVR